MKKILRVFFVLVLTAALVVPQAGLFFQKDVTPSVAAGDDTLYISELKVAYSYPGESVDAGIKVLESEGYTVMQNEDGNKVEVTRYYKKFEKRNHVYLGYKTTTDPKEAITDICVEVVDDANTPIPLTVKDEKASSETYEVVKCSRREGTTDREKERYKLLGDAADLHGDGDPGWVALYTVKDEKMTPILERGFIISDDFENDCLYGAHFFGVDQQLNICRWENAEPERIPWVLILFERGDRSVNNMVASTAGSMFSTSVTWTIIIDVAALIVGLLIGVLISSKRSRQNNS